MYYVGGEDDFFFGVNGLFEVVGVYFDVGCFFFVVE